MRLVNNLANITAAWLSAAFTIPVFAQDSPEPEETSPKRSLQEEGAARVQIFHGRHRVA
jgi:hypothetical protein